MTELDALEAAPPPVAAAAPSTLRSTLASVLAVVLVLAVGGVATHQAWQMAKGTEERDVASSIAAHGRARADDVQNVLALIQESVYGVAAHLAASSGDAGFEAFAARSLERHQSIAAIGLIETASSLSGETPMEVGGLPVTQRDWLNNFVPVERRARHLVLTKIVTRTQDSENDAARRRFLGFDFGSDEGWGAAIARAESTASLQVSFAGLAGDDSLLMMPVRDGSGAVSRYVVAALSLPQLMGRGLADPGEGMLSRVFEKR